MLYRCPVYVGFTVVVISLRILHVIIINNILPGLIAGDVPEWLEGCLIRNGSGKYNVGKDQYKHLFDGLSVLHQYRFEKGKVWYRNKLLDSEAKRRNLAAQRIVVGEFGTVHVPDPCKSIFTR